MRHIHLLYAFFSLLFLGASLKIHAQGIPQGISYQALARSMDGIPLAESFIDVKIGIRSGSLNGPLEWVEEHGVQTDAFGLFHLVIGEGVPNGEGSAPTFEEISWGDNDHFLSVWIDSGTGTFELMGTSQLLSVPYALVAGRALNNDDADADPQNELITALSLNGNTLEIQEGNEFHSIDLGPAISDGDNNAANESLTLLQLQGTVLNIVESGQAHQLDLASIADDGDWVKEPGKVYNVSDNIGVGTSIPSSSFHVNGSIAGKVIVFSGPDEIVLDETHHIVIMNVSDQNMLVQLPDAGSCNGRIYYIKKTSNQAEGVPITNTLTVSATPGQNIDGSADLLLNSFFRQEIGIVSDGSNWWIIQRSTNE